MENLLEEMQQCKSVQACIDLALTDAYGEEEDAVAWLTCIETMFGRFKQVRVLGNNAVLVGFDLDRHSVVARCRNGKHKIRATLDSIDFPQLAPVEQRWLKPWKKYSAQAA